MDSAEVVVRVPSTGRILLVEDDPGVRRANVRILEGAGFVVAQAADGLRAIEAIEHEVFDAILTDLAMPGMSGMQLLRTLRERAIDVPVVLITADPTVESAIDAVEHGAARYLVKPVRRPDLVGAMERATRFGRLAQVKRDSLAFLAAGSSALAHADMEASLERALSTLWMAYQPIVDWKRKRIVAYEALVRTGDSTLANPGALFSIAERLGAVHAVGRAIRASVAATLLANPSLQVFVNLHPSDLLDDELFAEDAPLSPFADRIVLEVTERQALNEASGIAARAARLRGLGYRIAIDDLGAGFSGLTYFALLSPEVVKIDLSLVRDIDKESIKQKLVGSLVLLCKELGMIVVAEGIETAEERAVVVDLGCDLLQGYLFARPGKPFPEVQW